MAEFVHSATSETKAPTCELSLKATFGIRSTKCRENLAAISYPKKKEKKIHIYYTKKMYGTTQPMIHHIEHATIYFFRKILADRISYAKPIRSYNT